MKLKSKINENLVVFGHLAKKNHILILNLVTTETISASDQKSTMPFLKKGVLKIYEDFFTMTLFKDGEMSDSLGVN